jgi:hypothetical protein
LPIEEEEEASKGLVVASEDGLHCTGHPKIPPGRGVPDKKK